MLTMRPQPRSVIPSITCRVTLKTLFRLVLITACQSAGDMRLNTPSRVMAALLTRMSPGPVPCRGSWLPVSLLPPSSWSDLSPENHFLRCSSDSVLDIAPGRGLYEFEFRITQPRTRFDPLTAETLEPGAPVGPPASGPF